MQVAGYSESDLLGIQHNIVRHPDMPRGVFKFLWQTLTQEQEFCGYVKTSAKMVLTIVSLPTSPPTTMTKACSRGITPCAATQAAKRLKP